MGTSYTKSFLSERYIILLTEYTRLLSEQNSFPKGSIQRKVIKGHEYNYLQYRDGVTVRTDYVSESNLSDLKLTIEKRHINERLIKEIKEEMKQIYKVGGVPSHLLNTFVAYEPVKDLDYDAYTQYMSHISHEYKRLGALDFNEKYNHATGKGIYGRYLKGFLNHINNTNDEKYRKSFSLVLDPFTYHMYFDFNQKDVLESSLKQSIPAFLQQGILITDIQEAVIGSSN